MPLRCTDILCLLAFLAYLCVMVTILGYAFRHGDPRRLTHGIDWQGRFCGVDENVTDRPLLYWCGEGNSSGVTYAHGVPVSFNLHGPICVSDCPSDTTLSLLCPMASHTKKVITNTSHAYTMTTIIVQEAAAQASYPTRTFMGKYCIPSPDDDGDEEAYYDTFVNSTAIGDMSEEFMNAIGSIAEAGFPLVCIGLVALGLSFGYMLSLQWCGREMYYVVTIVLCLTLYACGLSLLSTAFNLTGHQEDSPLYFHLDEHHAFIISVVLGSLFLLMALTLTCLVCCFRDTVDTALGCLVAAADCITHECSLLVEPIIDVALRLTLFTFLLFGLVWLVSSGDVQTDNSATIGGVKVTGVKRSFSYTEDEIYMMIIYIFGAFWILEFAHALGQFVISYMVVLWYYQPIESGHKRSPWCPLPRAYLAALVFHAGSLAMGSFLIAVLRIPQILLGYFAKRAKAKGENPVLACCLVCCKCCIDCFTRCMEYINQNAYIDIAINSNDFCTAARRSFSFIASSGAEIVLLSGATIVFTAIGVLSVTFSCALLGYWMVTNIPDYSLESSPGEIPNPTAVAVMAGLIGLIVSSAFMVVLDQTADTLLYTFTWNKAHDPDTVRIYAPEELADLVANKKGGDE